MRNVASALNRANERALGIMTRSRERASARENFSHKRAISCQALLHIHEHFVQLVVRDSLNAGWFPIW